LIAKKFPHITKQESGQNIKRLKIFIFPRCIVFTIYQIVKKFDSTITCLEGHRPNQQDAAQNGAGVNHLASASSCLHAVNSNAPKSSMI
jgi:hypothetical protein